MESTPYTPPATNVFKASELDWAFLIPTSMGDKASIVGKWFWAEVNWRDFHGPYDYRSDANMAFQVYAREVKMCPSGGCED